MANLRVDKITSTETFETTGSVQFGSGKTMKLSANSGFDLTDNDFTVECWMCMNEIQSFQQLILYTVDGTEDDTVWQFDITSTQLRFVAYVSNSSEVYGTNFSFTPSTWYHIAATRTNDLIRLFVDGDLIGTHPFSSTIDTEASAEINIGFRNNQGTADRFVEGNLSNIRIIKGKALYTDDFKPPMRELEVVPGTALLACQSKTDPTLEKTGKTITITGNLSASELTPGILTPVPKAGAGSAITGSVEFSGSSGASNLAISNASSLGGFTGDFTIEFWFIGDSQKANAVFLETHNVGAGTGQRWAIQADSSATENMIWVRDGNVEITTSGTDALDNSWHHHAVVRSGSTITYYIDGVNRGTESHSGTLSACDSFIIGAWSQDPGYEIKGHLSNVRIIGGTALYTGDFIPPTRELKKVPGTVLLCCQDSNNPTQEATGKTISLNGIYTYDTVVNSGITTTPVSTNFTPQVGDDRKVTFEGVTKINSDAYFYLPTGDTVTRNTRSGRGVLGGGRSPSSQNIIDFVNIASTGNAQDFGDLTRATMGAGACSSVTRGLFGSGASPGADNTIEFVTIATTGNAQNFGDLTYAPQACGAVSNNTRGIFAGGEVSSNSVNTINFVTIASTGDAKDFGDLVQTRRQFIGSCSSPTRGLFAGGYQDPASTRTNAIEFITISSTGNGIDFGDLTTTVDKLAGVSSKTRGVFAGGFSPSSPNRSDTIAYVTIASTGDAIDFGDLIVETFAIGGGASNSERGLYTGGATPSVTNAIDYITIASTGDAKDFGDLVMARRHPGGVSDSHGGLG